MEPETRLLRYFLAVAEELNFTRAASRLHIAQPSLSAGHDTVPQLLQALHDGTSRITVTTGLLPTAQVLVAVRDGRCDVGVARAPGFDGRRPAPAATSRPARCPRRS